MMSAIGSLNSVQSFTGIELRFYRKLKQETIRKFSRNIDWMIGGKMTFLSLLSVEPLMVNGGTDTLTLAVTHVTISTISMAHGGTRDILKQTPRKILIFIHQFSYSAVACTSIGNL